MENSERKLSEIYEEYINSTNICASDNTHKAYSSMNDAFNDYLSSIEEDSWKEGFLYAVSLAKKGVSLCQL